MQESVNTQMHQAAGLQASNHIGVSTKFENYYHVECHGADGTLKWVEDFENLVVNEGLDHILDIVLSGGVQITTWYVGLKNTGTAVAADTMLSHASWTENVTYSEAVRQTWTDGGVSGQSVDNSASKAAFSINGTTTIFGAFLVSNSTKSGSTGVLYGVGDFASSRAVINGDTLSVTITCTAA